MKCMCAQTRPRFILSSKRVLGGMEFEPILTPREKSPLLENFPRGGLNPRHCGQRAKTLPNELFRPCSDYEKARPGRQSNYDSSSVQLQALTKLYQTLLKPRDENRLKLSQLYLCFHMILFSVVLVTHRHSGR